MSRDVRRLQTVDIFQGKSTQILRLWIKDRDPVLFTHGWLISPFGS